MLQTNLHPDGHIYMRAIAGSSVQSHIYTLFNRVECKNIGKDILRIGKIRFMRAAHLPQSVGISLNVFGLDGQGGDTVLRPGSTLFVYLAFANAIPAGYAGMLDIPVLDGHTGVHAHVFISRAHSASYQRRPIAVQSGVYPVFVHEGLHASLQADGTGRTLQPKDSSSGAHLRLSLAALGIPKGNWALPPPRDPKYSVFQSTNPRVFAREDVAGANTAMVDGAMLPLLRPQEGLHLLAPQPVDGELEQKLQSIWPQQTGDGFAAAVPALLDGELHAVLPVIHVTWPQQGEEGFAAGAAQLIDGEIVVKTYSTLDIEEETPLFGHIPQILDAELETL